MCGLVLNALEGWIEFNSIGKWIRGFVLVLVYVDVRTNDPHLDSPLTGGRIEAILGRKCINQPRMEKILP